MKFDERGREIVGNHLVEFPLRWKRPLTLQEQIRQHIRTYISEQAAAQGEETFEEADDFDVDDDFDPRSPWELNYDQEREGIGGESGGGAANGNDGGHRKESGDDSADGKGDAEVEKRTAEKSAGGGTAGASKT